MNEFEIWLNANLAQAAFAAEQLKLEAERRRQEEQRAWLRLRAPDAFANRDDEFPSW